MGIVNKAKTFALLMIPNFKSYKHPVLPSEEEVLEVSKEVIEVLVKVNTALLSNKYNFILRRHKKKLQKYSAELVYTQDIFLLITILKDTRDIDTYLEELSLN